ncbi:hypothetical protein [Leptolyngbya sp. FACHB-17]|uniref:hypothetical protein n=1 Tax=unclassified Leptolyngbya TaxID=2650499 RepID=UPI001F54ABFF|nr:hypothetical protein [Leptolyngbya sp. FACHB-17]
MVITILFIVIALVAWALHLMQEAIEQKEFSLMLAGTLVSMAATALVGVYFVMGNVMGYVSHLSPQETAMNQEAYESVARYLEEQDQLYMGASVSRSVPQIARNISP